LVIEDCNEFIAFKISVVPTTRDDCGIVTELISGKRMKIKQNKRFGR